MMGRWRSLTRIGGLLVARGDCVWAQHVAVVAVRAGVEKADFAVPAFGRAAANGVWVGTGSCKQALL